MGDANRKRKKRQQLLKNQPICVFCGTNSSTTVDHIPSRQCFKNRIGPEDFEFGACESCNKLTRNLEQISALYLHAFGPISEGVPTESELIKLLQGVRNNNPNSLPNLDLTANQKRRAAKNFYAFETPFQSYSESPIIEVPREAVLALKVSNRKLACALYYKETNHILPQSAMVANIQSQIGHNTEKKLVEFAKNQLPNLRKAERRNTNIGDQFLYLWNATEDAKLFSYIAQFHKSFVFFAAISLLENESYQNFWTSHANDIQTNWYTTDICNSSN